MSPLWEPSGEGKDLTGGKPAPWTSSPVLGPVTPELDLQTETSWGFTRGDPQRQLLRETLSVKGVSQIGKHPSRSPGHGGGHENCPLPSVTFGGLAI